jgi:hypothetical protein
MAERYGIGIVTEALNKSFGNYSISYPDKIKYACGVAKKMKEEQDSPEKKEAHEEMRKFYTAWNRIFKYKLSVDDTLKDELYSLFLSGERFLDFDSVIKERIASAKEQGTTVCDAMLDYINVRMFLKNNP